MSTLRTLLVIALGTLVVACRDAKPVPNAAATPVDPYAPASLIVAFRARAPEHPTALGVGATTDADSLLARYAAGILARDTVALRPLALSVSEFAWLYYLDSPMAQRPYELDPDVMWMQIQSQSTRGLTRALQQFGGKQAVVRSTSCAAPRAAGALQLIDCTLTLRLVGDSTVGTPLRLSVVARDGRFKLVGFGTSL